MRKRRVIPNAPFTCRNLTQMTEPKIRDRIRHFFLQSCRDLQSNWSILHAGIWIFKAQESPSESLAHRHYTVTVIITDNAIFLTASRKNFPFFRDAVQNEVKRTIDRQADTTSRIMITLKTLCVIVTMIVAATTLSKREGERPGRFLFSVVR